MLPLCRDQELSLNKALRRTSATGSIVGAAREGMVCCSRLPLATRLIPHQHGTKSDKLSHVDVTAAYAPYPLFPSLGHYRLLPFVLFKLYRKLAMVGKM